MQHRRTEQGRSRHLPQEGVRAAVTASLKDTAGTASPCCCGHQAGACILAVETVMHGRTPGWHHPSGFACGKGKSGPGEAAGSKLQGSAMAGSGDRLRLPRVGRCARQPCPGRQGLKPCLFIAAAQPGPAASNHLLPLYSWPLVQLSTAAPPDRSGHSLHPHSSQQDLASSLPASCPVPAAPCLRLSPPQWCPGAGTPRQDAVPQGLPCPGLAPCPAREPRAAPASRSWRRCQPDGT